MQFQQPAEASILHPFCAEVDDDHSKRHARITGSLYESQLRHGGHEPERARSRFRALKRLLAVLGWGRAAPPIRESDVAVDRRPDASRQLLPFRPSDVVLPAPHVTFAVSNCSC